MAGGWEFPGGKLEPGEERVAGLARELREELGITIATPRPLIRVCHAYPTREVLLDIWVVRQYGGEPRGLDGQALRWCTEDELATADLLPADKPIVTALRLPDRITQISTPCYSIADSSLLGYSSVDAGITRDTQLRGVYCASAVEAVAAAGAGADFLVMRVALADDGLLALCDMVPTPVFAIGIGLEQAWALGASGINELYE